MSTALALIHDDDVVLYFDATQEARHAAMIQANQIGRSMVERAIVNAVGQQPDEDGVFPGPGQIRLVLGFAREDKSAKQRKFLHGVVFKQISEQVVLPDGARYAIPVWKEFFRARFLPDTWESRKAMRWDAKLGRMVQAKRATPHRVRISTESLTVKQYSEHIDRVIDAAVLEYGVVFDFVAQEREEVRYRRPARPARTARPASTDLPLVERVEETSNVE
jgi:hypothetical protein